MKQQITQAKASSLLRSLQINVESFHIGMILHDDLNNVHSMQDIANKLQTSDKTRILDVAEKQLSRFEIM